MKFTNDEILEVLYKISKEKEVIVANSRGDRKRWDRAYLESSILSIVIEKYEKKKKKKEKEKRER
jgi:hypothetical protein